MSLSTNRDCERTSNEPVKKPALSFAPLHRGSKSNSRKRPLASLTVGLHTTYCHICPPENGARFIRSRRARDRRYVGYDNDDNDYIAIRGEMVNKKYQVVELIGAGSFSKVYKASKITDGSLVAIKFIKNKGSFSAQAQTEISLLRRMYEKDPSVEKYCATLLDSFQHNGHQCLVFELFSMSLCELLQVVPGLSLAVVRKIGFQILKALAFLSCSNIDVIHCDLKPDNIMLRSTNSLELKVILGIPYTRAIDMWSMGCILVELHTGDPLFPASSTFDHLCRMVEVLGMPSDTFLSKVPNAEFQKYFEKSSFTILRSVSKQYLPTPNGISLRTDILSQWKKGKEKQHRLLSPKTLRQVIIGDLEGLHSKFHFVNGHDEESYEMFIDLVSKMLIYDPDSRITPEEALEHPFMKCIANSHQSIDLPWSEVHVTGSHNFLSDSRSASKISVQNQVFRRHKKICGYKTPVLPPNEISRECFEVNDEAIDLKLHFDESSFETLETPSPTRRSDTIGVLRATDVSV